jgi:hypothetical protein
VCLSNELDGVLLIPVNVKGEVVVRATGGCVGGCGMCGGGGGGGGGGWGVGSVVVVVVAAVGQGGVAMVRL